MKNGPLRLVWGCAILSLSVLFTFSIVGFVAYVKFGFDGVGTSATAGAICWFAATLALVLTMKLGTASQPVSGTLIATGVRFGLPLLAGIVLQSTSQLFAATGGFGWIVVFYVQTLIVETVLSVHMLHRRFQGDTKGIATNG